MIVADTSLGTRGAQLFRLHNQAETVIPARRAAAIHFATSGQSCKSETLETIVNRGEGEVISISPGDLLEERRVSSDPQEKLQDEPMRGKVF